MEDILRARVLDYNGKWNDYLTLIKFVFNNIYHVNIHMAPFEALYECKYRSYIGWLEVGEEVVVGMNSVLEAMENV